MTLSGILRETLSDDLFLTARSGGARPTTSATLTLRLDLSHGGLNLDGLGWLNGSLPTGAQSSRRIQSGLGIGGDIALSPRAHVRLNTSYSDGLNLDAIYGSQEAFPELDVKSLLGDVGFSYRVGPSTSVGATLSGMFIRYRTRGPFDSSALPGDAFVPPEVLQPAVPGGPEQPAPPAPVPAPLVPDSTIPVLGVLTAAGLQTPNLDYWTWRAGGDVSHQFSSRTRGRLAVGYRGAFGSPAGFTEGDQIDAQVEWSRVLAETSTVSLSYTDQETRASSRFGTHSLSVRMDKTLSRKLTVDGSLGGSYLEAPQRADASFDVIGGAGLSLRLGRTALSLRYDRNRYQSLLGRHSYTADSGMASLARRLTRQISLSTFGSYRNSADALAQAGSYRSIFVGTSLGMRIGKRVNAGAVYSYQTFARGTFPSSNRYVASVFAGYSLARR